ncbi:MAG TPA: DUF3800 domain-containing protein [Candidatus Saccharimonadales bacterium]|nr:DUF3800 domain-containing protein [Candidatus Saccharimonadales bacterium]
MIVAYADESGTHDRTGQQTGASTATVGGYIGLLDDWIKFDSEWKAILNKYAVPSFHFKDWTAAQKAAVKAGSSYVGKAGYYKGWKRRCLLEFMEDLSKIIYANNIFPFGGWVDAEKVHNAKASGVVPITLDPYEGCLRWCFEQISDIVFLRWPKNYGSEINVVFDLTQDRDWMSKVENQFNFAKNQNSRFTSLAFTDDKGASGNGIQAADLISGYIRKESQKQRQGILEMQQSWEKKICKGKRFDLPRNP